MDTISSQMNMKGRTVVITGGCGHLGQTMAHTLAEAGADIVIVDMFQDKIDAFCAELQKRWGVTTLGIAANLEEEAERRSIPQKVVEAMGRLDVLINNAAFVGTSKLTGWGVPFEQQETETWRRALEVNLTAIFDLTQSALPYLRASGHGSIINVASIYGIVGADPRLYEGLDMFNPAAYAASKGGLVQFTKWCATVLAPEVRVNAITPGGIFCNHENPFLERYEQKTPLKRMAHEEDFIGATIFLASDLSRYITGQNIVVDGGFSVW